MRTFTYYDSIAGMQHEKFNKLSELIKYLEDFAHTGEESSTGIIYDNNEPILMYNSSLDGLFWQNYGEQCTHPRDKREYIGSNMLRCKVCGEELHKTMNIADIEHKLNGTKPMPKCNDLYTLLGAVKVKDYKCPKCGKWHNDSNEQYDVNNEQYPKYFNESKGSTIDGSYWDWDEVHACEDCETKYWFSNGAY